MLDKLKFNNLVLSNAKVIQKVRIQIVRKIIQRMRKLKNLLEKRPGDPSNVVKQRKCVAIVERVKKMKRQDVITNILLLDKNPNKIVTNSQSTPEDVAIALFAANKAMQELTLRFRQEQNYNEEEAESWKKTLIEIGKQKAKKQRRKKNAEKREKQLKKNGATELKQPKKKTKAAVNGTKLEPSKEFSKEIESVEDEDDVAELDLDRSTSVVKVEKSNNKTKKNVKIKTLETTEDNDIKPLKIAKAQMLETNFDDDDDDELLETPKAKKQQNTNDSRTAKVRVETATADDLYSSKLANPKKLEKSTQKTTKTKTAPQFLSGYEEADEMSHKAVKPKANDAEEHVQVGVVDPFFLTTDGKPYIANIVLKPEKITNADSSDKPQKEFTRNPKRITTERREYDQNPRKFKADSSNDKQNQEVLHPSWMAKKKLNSIADFRGKKITFGDDISTEHIEVRRNSTITDSKENAKSDLHPSWAAKQKLKPTISAFQGKKITFGDDE